MQLKIKAKPEDFIVEEIASPPLSKKGNFAVYLLQKRNWNTVELLLNFSKELGIPFHCFSYGGRKDRHSLATQYITIKHAGRFELTKKDYSLKFIGYMARPMGSDLIEGNSFDIAVRGLNKGQTDKIAPEIETVRSIGYPNYFDDQRFGGMDPIQGFFGEKILKGQFNGALKIYITAVKTEDSKEDKLRKKSLFENWKDWDTCLSEAVTQTEKEAFEFLKCNPKGFFELLKKIPRHELSGFISSYQSFLWNEILRRVIKSILHDHGIIYKGIAGEYIFYPHLKEEEYHSLKDLNLPVPGARPKLENISKSFYNEVLEENGIKNSMFGRLRLRPFFKSFTRKVIVKPDSINFSILDDELYKDKKKLLLKFTLPRGSYGTMLIKRIFSF